MEYVPNPATNDTLPPKKSRMPLSESAARKISTPVKNARLATRARLEAYGLF
jgi:hypothetical protein